ncbi:MAG: hypothetical protein ACFFDK_07030 [Promethearchaeota archaeon]
MSKALSYFDWELDFRKKSQLNHNSEIKIMRITNKKEVNSLGIDENIYKNFMKKWKEKNL